MTGHNPLAMDPALADDIAPDRAAFVAKGFWSDERQGATIAALAAQQPDAEAVVDRKGARRKTFRDLDRDSNRLANWFVDAGIGEGDVIAMQLPNCYEAVVVTMGASKAGVAVNPMLTVYRANELRHMMGMTRAKAIFTPDVYRGFSHRDLADQLAADLDHDFQSIVIDVTDDDADGPADWLDDLEAWPETPCGVSAPASNVSVILFTSGTEAKPKAVMHTEQTLTSNIRSVWQSMEMGENEVIWMPSPVGHSTGFNYGIRFALIHGAKLVLQDRWAPEAAAELVVRERPTFTLAATIFLTDLLGMAEASDIDISCLRIFGCGGAPIPAPIVTAATTRGVNVLRLYGQTETMVATLNRPSSPLQKRIDTDGNAVDGFKVEIRDENGVEVPRGTPGELCVTGPGMSVGYYKDADRTLVKFRAGWAHTADLAEMDEDGYITIVGRISEIVIRGGLNIIPREVEEEISKMTGVAAVAVIGLPHERLGEQCCACIVPEKGALPSLEQICDHLRAAGFAAFKLPEQLEIVDALPTTASGKIQRHKLVEKFADGTN